jgi:DNA-binding XRE family transcriptional regulator
MSLPLVGHKIRELRLNAQMSQRQLAERVGVSANYIWIIEHDKKLPSLTVADKIATQLGVRTNDLFSDNPILPELRELVEKAGITRIIQDLSKLIEAEHGKQH